MSQNRGKMSYGGIRGCKMHLLEPKNPKKKVSGRPGRFIPAKIAIYHITYFGRSGRKTGRIGRKIYFLDSLAQGDHFCTLEHLHISFWGDSELDQMSAEIRFCQNWPKIGKKMSMTKNFGSTFFPAWKVYTTKPR